MLLLMQLDRFAVTGSNGTQMMSQATLYTCLVRSWHPLLRLMCFVAQPGYCAANGKCAEGRVPDMAENILCGEVRLDRLFAHSHLFVDLFSVCLVTARPAFMASSCPHVLSRCSGMANVSSAASPTLA